MDFERDTGDEDGGAGGVQVQDIKSYLAFASRALRNRRGMIALIFIPLAALTIGLVSIWPRTYHCESRLMTLRNQVLESQEAGPAPLDGASSVITRRENLVAIAKQTDLIHNWTAQRPMVLQLKDRFMFWLRGGPPSDADILNVMVNYLEGRLSANAADSVLTISVDWPEPQMAARLVETAQQTFMESRHVAEIATIQEKISILEGHSGKLRDEIEDIAEQLQRMREDKLADLGKSAKEADSAAAPTPAQAPIIRRVIRPIPLSAEQTEDLAQMKSDLEAKKHTIADLEADRGRRLIDEQAKVAELQFKYTPAHPAVLSAQQSLAMLEHESAQVTALRAEVRTLDGQIKDRTGARSDSFTGGSGGGSSSFAAGASPAAEVLPSKIMQLLDSGAGVDPAVSAQLGSAVSKYASLRDSIRTARIELDTAQAAFNHRYKVLVPAEVPAKASKPKVPVMVAGGLFAALFLSLLVPILAELRTGIIVERWQVNNVRLPILAELHLPPGSSD